MALTGVGALKELELYDTEETGVLELCEKPPRDVNNGFNLWRSRDPSRLSPIVINLRCPSSTAIPHADKTQTPLQAGERSCPIVSDCEGNERDR